MAADLRCKTCFEWTIINSESDFIVLVCKLYRDVGMLQAVAM